jgi:hypothetical protein
LKNKHHPEIKTVYLAAIYTEGCFSTLSKPVLDEGKISQNISVEH